MSRQFVFNYFELRLVIGALGMALPFVVPIGARVVFGDGLQHFRARKQDL